MGKFIKIVMFTIVVSTFFMTACSDITTKEVIKKYRENPRRGGVREDIITHDLLPDIKKDAKQDLIAISYAEDCFSVAQSVEDAEACRIKIVKRYGDEYSLPSFTKWNESTKQKVLDFFIFNKASAECYIRAEKARDILPCKDPIDPNF